MCAIQFNPPTDNNTAAMFTAANLTALFACTVDMPAANESESRMNSTTRAELFAGVLRAFRQHRHRATG